MKKIIQLALCCIVIIAIFSFYQKYFSKDDKTITNSVMPDKELAQDSKNNLIKNLKYEINLDQDKNYIITSELSELFFEDTKNDFVKMKIVKAIIQDQQKIPLIIKSDNAIYNNFNYNTKFRNNVSIEYLDNKIFSDKLDLDIENNLIKIFGNVRYESNNGTIISDNINVNLKTKKIDIYMNNEIDDVKVEKN